MKFLVALLPLALAASSKRETIEETTDTLLFTDTLPEFTDHRNRNDPSTLDFSSDGCTKSPDNPFGFPYEPACNRHDFGYQNFRAQSRFTKENKAKIDENFHKDLLFQCDTNGHGKPCHALADVYFAAVKAFGGGDATKRGLAEAKDWVAEYYRLVEVYHDAVKEAQDAGELPILDSQ